MLQVLKSEYGLNKLFHIQNLTFYIYDSKRNNLSVHCRILFKSTKSKWKCKHVLQYSIKIADLKRLNFRKIISKKWKIDFLSRFHQAFIIFFIRSRVCRYVFIVYVMILLQTVFAEKMSTSKKTDKLNGIGFHSKWNLIFILKHFFFLNC